jgi:hypothetical protein
MYTKLPRAQISPLGFNARSSIITSTQLLAMFTTPQVIVPAPRPGNANVFFGASIRKPAGTAYNLTTATGLSVKYTDGSGLEVSQAALVGFLDQTTLQARWLKPHTAASGANTTLMVAASPLVLQVLTANITTGTGGLKVTAFYTVVPVT